MIKRLSSSALLVVVGILLMGSDWPTYMHDQQRSSAGDDPTIGVAEAGHLVTLWTFHTGGPKSAAEPAVER